MKRLEVLIGTVLPTLMDRDLAFPDRPMEQNSIYFTIERRRLFFLLPNGTQGGITKVAALMAQIKRVN